MSPTVIIICIIILIIGKMVSKWLANMAAESWRGCFVALLIFAFIFAGVLVYWASVAQEAGWLK